ncbi:MAG: ATP-binding protein [Kribbellaceae bacterium]
MLYGRADECASLERLLDEARAGRGGALVLRGDPGIGKTALLDHVSGHTSEMRVLRTRGVQAETRISFAGLHAALRPILSDVTSLPGPQAAALKGALGLAEARGHSRFLVAAGVLGLLAEVAERQPVLCLVDDAQWLDGSSRDALLFAARRIETDRIAIVFTARTGEADLAGLPELLLGPIAPAPAEELLTGRAGAALSAADRARVTAAAAGNPLALVELSAEGAAGTAGGSVFLPLSSRLQQAFLHRVHDLPRDVQRLLLLAAADDSGSLGLLLSAGEVMQIDRCSLADAERAQLLTVRDGEVDFRHPLVRSAVYQAATFIERQEVHSALATCLVDDAESCRRAWHQAAAAVAPDEDVASDLELAAHKQRAQSGHAAAAAALERAAALTADPDRRARLLLDAAEDAWESGVADQAAALVEQAGRVASGLLLHGRIAQLRGRLEARRGDVNHGCEILVAGADRIAELEPARAAAMLVDALQAASYGGDLARVAAVAARRAELLLGEKAAHPAAAFVAGVGALLGGDAVRAVPLLRDVLSQAERSDDPVLLTWAGTASVYLGDTETARVYGARSVARCRATGALSTLAYALELLALTELPGNPSGTEADATEGLRLARETDQPGSAAVHVSMLAVVAAMRGDEEATRAYADEVAVLAATHGLGSPQARATAALAALDLGLGRPEHALDRLESLAAVAHPGVTLSYTSDVVEAAVRAGQRERGLEAMRAFETWATSTGSPWVTSMLARCRALLATGSEAAAHFEDALRHHASAGPSIDLARTQLLYGEFLRRERRRTDARRYLREASETFDRLGARPWAARARAELRASGETARRQAGSREQLTPQERQIARFVAAGASNKEVAAQLYLSPRTVDAHLRSVYSKLGIASRRQLRDAEV